MTTADRRSERPTVGAFVESNMFDGKHRHCVCFYGGRSSCCFCHINLKYCRVTHDYAPPNRPVQTIELPEE